MVDPHNITDFNRSMAQLEEFMLFVPAVAGKRAVTISDKLRDFLTIGRVSICETFASPFEIIRGLGPVATNALLKQVKLGKYSVLGPCYNDLAASRVDLKTCTAADLEKFKGVGFKTSRYFILHSRPNQNLAVLDTHMLRHLRDNGISAPKSTPSSAKKYQELEAHVLKMAKAAKKSVADFDLEIWCKYTKSKPIVNVGGALTAIPIQEYGNKNNH